MKTNFVIEDANGYLVNEGSVMTFRSEGLKKEKDRTYVTLDRIDLDKHDEEYTIELGLSWFNKSGEMRTATRMYFPDSVTIVKDNDTEVGLFLEEWVSIPDDCENCGYCDCCESY